MRSYVAYPPDFARYAAQVGMRSRQENAREAVLLLSLLGKEHPKRLTVQEAGALGVPVVEAAQCFRSWFDHNLAWLSDAEDAAKNGLQVRARTLDRDLVAEFWDPGSNHLQGPNPCQIRKRLAVLTDSLSRGCC